MVGLGGARELLNMLKTAKDDKTRKEALKALVALSHSGKYDRSIVAEIDFDSQQRYHCALHSFHGRLPHN